MAAMMEKLYDALRAASVPDDKARAAAVEAANFENPLTPVEAELLVIKWMIGVNIAISLAALGGVITVIGRLH